MHQLCHWAASVSSWGPAWSHSSFPFESNNRTLLKLVHGTQYVPQQMAQNYDHVFRCTKKLANICISEAREACKELFAHVSHTGSYRTVHRTLINKIEFLGKAHVRQLNVQHHVAIEHLLGKERTSLDCIYYDRFHFQGRVFHCHRYYRVSSCLYIWH